MIFILKPEPKHIEYVDKYWETKNNIQ